MTSLRNPNRRSPLAGRFDAEAAALQHRLAHGGDTAGPSSPGGPDRPAIAAPPTTWVSPTGVLPCQVHDPDLWFADAPADLELAKALCAGCPVRVACLTGALERREPTGVWGGQILDSGEIVSHKRPRGRPSKGSTTPQRRQFRPPGPPRAHGPAGGRPSRTARTDRAGRER